MRLPSTPVPIRITCFCKCVWGWKATSYVAHCLDEVVEQLEMINEKY